MGARGIIQLKGIAKSYGAVTALRDASLTLEGGEFHALLGMNGSGKSTVIKVLSGVIRPDAGEIRCDGQAVAFASPADARRLGIVVAYQDLSLIPTLSVLENVVLAIQGSRPGSRLDLARERTLALCRELGLTLDLEASVGALPTPARYQLEIVKALAQEPDLLVLDESTAALDRNQVEAVFALLRRLNAGGLGVLFVSHRMDEVMRLATRVTVIRDGTTVASVPLAETTRERLVATLVGEDAQPRPASPVTSSGPGPADADLAVEVRELSRPPRLAPATVRVRQGEIVGLGGLQGQGQREFLRAVAWLDPPATGQVRVGPRGIPIAGERRARAHVWYVSGDRGREGVFPGRAVWENVYAQEIGIGGPTRRIAERDLRRRVIELLRRVRVVAQPTQPIETLSGGTQQKALLGRLLTRTPELVLLDDPTLGVDVHSRREIHDILRELASAGSGVLLFSTDDDELLSLCHRILVFFEGSIIHELQGEQLTREHLVRATLSPQEAS